MQGESIMAGPERAVEDAFVRWCKKNGLKARKLRELKSNGFPDRSIFIGSGMMICIEFKSPTGVLDSAQIKCIGELRDKGVPVLVTCELEEAKKFVAEWVYLEVEN
jgi:hypothetical protein